MNAPPELIVSTACNTASLSPCAKSKRGVVIYGFPPDMRHGGIIYGNAFNGPPEPLRCDGSASCRRDCARICVHAEMRAIMQAMWPSEIERFERVKEKRLFDLYLVHVKVDAHGKLVAGKPPSCEQCSRLILEAKIARVWLYERVFSHDHDDGSPGSMPVEIEPEWRFYTALEFHRTTLRNLELHGG